MQKAIFILVILCCAVWQGAAQDEESLGINAGRVLSIDINYGAGLPAGNMKDRFGFNFDVGGGFEIITAEQNWIFGIGAGVLFGNRVNEDVLINLRTPEPELQIIGSNAAWADVALRERGFHVEARVGKLIPLIEDNKRSGLRLVLGIGLLQHKIRLSEDPESLVPQILGDYAKGYDRLTNGLMLSEFIGYQHLAQNRLLNFYGGFELTQGFTQNRRDWDFATRMASDDSLRTDLLVGFKLGWVLPFYVSKSFAESIRY